MARKIIDTIKEEDINEGFDYEIFDQVANVVVHDYLNKKGFYTDTILIIDNMPVVLASNEEGEAYLFQLLVCIDDKDYVDITGKKTFRLLERGKELNKAARKFDAIVYKINFKVYSEKNEDTTGYFYTNYKKYYFKEMFAVLIEKRKTIRLEEYINE